MNFPGVMSGRLSIIILLLDLLLSLGPLPSSPVNSTSTTGGFFESRGESLLLCSFSSDGLRISDSIPALFRPQDSTRDKFSKPSVPRSQSSYNSIEPL